MGNCVKKDSGNHWGGEYWGSPVESPENALVSRQKCMKKDVESSGDRPTKEVKIKVTKKQLEELLCMKEMHGMTLEQVLTQLINGGDEVFDLHQRSWRPELHSIPE